MSMKDDQRKGNKSSDSFWRFLWPFETSTEYESKDDAEALKYRDKNPLAEEESIESDDTGGAD